MTKPTIDPEPPADDSAPAEYASLADLLDGEVGWEDVVLSNGKSVRVRGITRFELILAGQGTEDPALVERRTLVNAMLIPKMTMAQMEKWQKVSRPDDIGAVTVAVRRLSGLAKESAKSDIPAV